MNTQIKVNVTKGKLTQREYDRAVRYPYTIDISGRTPTQSKIKKWLIASVTTLILAIGANVYVYANIPLEEQFVNDFQQVLEQEEIKEEDVDKLVEQLQEMVELEQVSEPLIDSSIFPQERVA